MNVSMLVLNLLVPAVPLNGALILSDFLQLAKLPVKTIAYINVGLSAAIGIAMIVLGAFRVWGGIIGIFIGVVVLASAVSLLKLARHGNAEQHPLFHARKAAGAQQFSMPPQGMKHEDW